MYRWVDHTAELELEVESSGPEQVLVEAAAALGELYGEAGGERVERPVEIAAGDLPALLVEWLEELVFLADTERFVPCSAELHVEGARLQGVLHARRGDPRPLVKAVTYHRAELAPHEEGWRGRVILDV